MLGFWFGINLILPFLAIYWLIKPDFLFYKKPLTRPKVFLVLAFLAFLNVIVLSLLAISPKEVGDYDILGFVIGIVACFWVGAWRFYRHGQYSILLKLSTKTTSVMSENPSDIANNYSGIINNNPSNYDLIINNTNPLKEKIESTQKTIEMTKTSLSTTNVFDNTNNPNAEDDDWQTYKQKMEQSWQETRAKIAKKPK